MKQIKYIATITLASVLALNLSGCSEKDEPATPDTEKGIAIESISATLEGMNSTNGTTRVTKEGFSVNGEDDPTKELPHERTGWKMDFTIYNGETKYDAGSFAGVTCDDDTLTVSGKYFPNYKNPQAEALIYPTGWTNVTEIAEDQSAAGGTTLLSHDILIKKKANIKVAHKVAIQVMHKHSMLDFVIKDIIKEDIDSVKVLIDKKTYTPYPVKGTQVSSSTTIYDMEYMLILPETTDKSPIVQIKTKAATGINSITYKQTIGIISSSKKTLESNKCYCFTLQGAELKLSPITVLNWASGESLPGEYIAVTAYPTFKADGHANKTYYFYYDNKLIEKDKDGKSKPKLQEIKFNENAECTIKPDGRIITHIFKDANSIPSEENTLEKVAGAPGFITLGAMVINVTSAIPSN